MAQVKMTAVREYGYASLEQHTGVLNRVGVLVAEDDSLDESWLVAASVDAGGSTVDGHVEGLRDLRDRVDLRGRRGVELAVSVVLRAGRLDVVRALKE
jgi:predicted deacylase